MEDMIMVQVEKGSDIILKVPLRTLFLRSVTNQGFIILRPYRMIVQQGNQESFVEMVTGDQEV